MTEAQYAWGVDPSTQRVAIAAAKSDRTEAVTSVEFDHSLRTGARLADIFDRTAGLAANWAREYPPLYVFVEAIAVFSSRINPELYYATGVIQAGLYSGLCDIFPHPVEVRTIESGTWKKSATGNGAIRKADILPWAKRNGYEGDQPDEADAWGVALAGANQIWPPQLALA